MLFLSAFQFLNARCQVFVASQEFAHFDERANDENTHVDGSLAVEHRR